jgi:MFS family permease
MKTTPSVGQSRTGVGRSLFHLRDFRWLSANMVLASVGMMGEIVVLGWLALELTNSPFLVGLAMGARALPLFFVGVPAGVLADRWPRHHLLIATGVGQALTAATLGTLVLFGVVGLPLLLLVTLTAGTLRGVEHAARQSYTHDVVGPQRLVPGLAVLGVAMRAGWLAGSLGAGAVIAVLGSGPAYLAVSAAYMAGAAALVRRSAPRRALPTEPESVWQNIVGFVVLVRRNRTLLTLMALTAGAEVLGFSHQSLLPSLARDVLQSGPEGLGVLNAARAVGGILGLFVSMRGAVAGGGTMFLAVLAGFGLSIVGLGLAPHLMGFWGVVLILVVVNAVGALADLLAQSLLQRGSPPHLRGRAGGAWVVAIGLAPLGQLQIGALASLVGVSAALGASGFALIALAAAAAQIYPRLRERE